MTRNYCTQSFDANPLGATASHGKLEGCSDGDSGVFERQYWYSWLLSQTSVAVAAVSPPGRLTHWPTVELNGSGV